MWGYSGTQEVKSPERWLQKYTASTYGYRHTHFARGWTAIPLGFSSPLLTIVSLLSPTKVLQSIADWLEHKHIQSCEIENKSHVSFVYVWQHDSYSYLKILQPLSHKKWLSNVPQDLVDWKFSKWIFSLRITRIHSCTHHKPFISPVHPAVDPINRQSLWRVQILRDNNVSGPTIQINSLNCLPACTSKVHLQNKYKKCYTVILYKMDK